MLDRGATGGWMPLWLCPCCGRCARDGVFADGPGASSRSHLQLHWPPTWRFLKCSRYRYPSQRRPGTHRGKGKPASWHYAAHSAAADKTYEALETPQRLTWERRMALEDLLLAHHRLAFNALGHAIPSHPGGLPPAVVLEASEAIRRIRWAHGKPAGIARGSHDLGLGGVLWLRRWDVEPLGTGLRRPHRPPGRPSARRPGWRALEGSVVSANWACFADHHASGIPAASISEPLARLLEPVTALIVVP